MAAVTAGVARGCSPTGGAATSAPTLIVAKVDAVGADGPPATDGGALPVGVSDAVGGGAYGTSPPGTGTAGPATSAETDGAGVADAVVGAIADDVAVSGGGSTRGVSETTGFDGSEAGADDTGGAYVADGDSEAGEDEAEGIEVAASDGDSEAGEDGVFAPDGLRERDAVGADASDDDAVEPVGCDDGDDTGAPLRETHGVDTTARVRDADAVTGDWAPRAAVAEAEADTGEGCTSADRLGVPAMLRDWVVVSAGNVARVVPIVVADADVAGLGVIVTVATAVVVAPIVIDTVVCGDGGDDDGDACLGVSVTVAVADVVAVPDADPSGVAGGVRDGLADCGAPVRDRVAVGDGCAVRVADAEGRGVCVALRLRADVDGDALAVADAEADADVVMDVDPDALPLRLPDADGDIVGVRERDMDGARDADHEGVTVAVRLPVADCVPECVIPDTVAVIETVAGAVAVVDAERGGDREAVGVRVGGTDAVTDRDADADAGRVRHTDGERVEHGDCADDGVARGAAVGMSATTRTRAPPLSAISSRPAATATPTGVSATAVAAPPSVESPHEPFPATMVTTPPATPPATRRTTRESLTRRSPPASKASPTVRSPNRPPMTAVAPPPAPFSMHTRLPYELAGSASSEK